MSEDRNRLKRHYFSKLFSSVFEVLLGMGVDLIVPRALGPKSYGSYSMITNFFQQIMNFMDMGSSKAYYTKVSMRNEERGIITFYFGFCGLLLVLVFFIITIFYQLDWLGLFLPNQVSIHILLGCCYCYTMWFHQVLDRTAHAYNLTVYNEVFNVVLKFLVFAACLVSFFMGRLDLTLFLMISFVSYTLVCSGLLVFFRFKISLKAVALRGVEIKAYLKEFYTYSKPLFFLALLSLICNIFDRWILEVTAGSVDQGYFGLSMRISAICYLFTSAMTPLMHREISFAQAKDDRKAQIDLFSKIVPVFHLISCAFSGFIMAHAGEVIHVIGGSEYADAKVAIMIMTIYPIHQTSINLYASIFFAMNKTSYYSRVGCVGLAVGLPLSYFLLASGGQGGLGLGAEGLALKMILVQLVAITCHMFYLSKLWGMNFFFLLLNHLKAIGAPMLLAFAIGYGSRGIFVESSLNVIWTLLFNGTLYALCLLVAAQMVPALLGINRGHVNEIKGMLAGVLGRGKGDA